VRVIKILLFDLVGPNDSIKKIKSKRVLYHRNRRNQILSEWKKDFQVPTIDSIANHMINQTERMKKHHTEDSKESNSYYLFWKVFLF
jgi:3-oxoacyl-ACP reductase-like protein